MAAPAPAPAPAPAIRNLDRLGLVAALCQELGIARWIFLCFGGIHEYRLGEAPPQVTELTGDQQVILEVLGGRYRKIYS
jgi:hypothetical protein